MSRTYRVMPPELWSRPAFRNLDHTAQHLYLLLWTHPTLTTAGTLDYHPARLAALTADLDPVTIDETITTLEDVGLVAADRDTAELAILTWWEDTTVLRQPDVTKNAIRKLHDVASGSIHQAVADTLHRLNIPPVPAGLTTEIALLHLADHPPTHHQQHQGEERLPESVWPGHPFTVDDPADARCAVHAGQRVVGECVACDAAVRLARGRLGG